MKRFLPPAALLSVMVLLALMARPSSPGMALSGAAQEWASALEQGLSREALEMMVPDSAGNYCSEFLLNLKTTPVPEEFVYSGRDSRGIIMAGETEEQGSRIIWLSSFHDPRIVHDTALDNLLGSAVFLCRENAAVNPHGCCPVSGRPYEYHESTGTVVCPEGHLGSGLAVGSGNCEARRDSVAAEVQAFIEAGYGIPETLEDMYLLSGGEYGRRGGYRCPDNGYSYYEIRDGEVYCPFHDETTTVAVEE